MSTPDPAVTPPPPPVAPPKKGGSKWLIGCLLVLVALVLLGMAVLMLGVYAAKRELDSMTPQAREGFQERFWAAEEAALGK